MVGICCDFAELMFSLYGIQTKNKSEGRVSLAGTTVPKLLLVTSAIFKKSILSGTGVRHKTSLEEKLLSLGT